MTTIAYKDGIVAYDSLCTAGSTIIDHNYNKRIDVGGVQFFVTGTVADFEKAIHAYFVDEDDLPHVDVEFLAHDNGLLFRCSVGEGRMFKTPKSLKTALAIGSGADHALTAMDCGLSAKEAVKKAAYRDTGTGGRIRTYQII